MNATELCFIPATDLSRLLRSKELSSVEVTEAILARIDRLNPSLQAYLTVTADLARAQAKAATERAARGALLSPLDGIPCSIKDLIATAGIRTTFGSRHFADYVPTADHLVARRLRATGAVILGKTNTPSFGHKDMTDNLLGPPSRNPWRFDRTPGGSSGGAAAAVAAGLGPLALGNDGGGSIRIPAALCGVVGFKPSAGRVPASGGADYWAARSQCGPIARTVRDAALLLRAIAGPDSADPLSIDAPPEDYARICDQEIQGLRVVWSGDLGYARVDPEVKAIAERAARRFSELGCPVEARDPGWDNPYTWNKAIWDVGYAATQGERASQHPDWADPTLLAMILEGERLTAVAYHEHLQARSAFYVQAHRFFQTCDLLLTPTMPLGAWAREPEPEGDVGDQRDRVVRFEAAERVAFTFPHNETGYPAISVPCGFTAEGLPVGLQIIGRWHQDALVLRAAANFEAIQPWLARRPGDGASVSGPGGSPPGA